MAAPLARHKHVTVGSFIKFEREARGWSQKELASLLGINQNEISRWENHSRFIGQKNAEKLCEVFNIPKDNISFLVREAPKRTGIGRVDLEDLSQIVQILQEMSENMVKMGAILSQAATTVEKKEKLYKLYVTMHEESHTNSEDVV